MIPVVDKEKCNGCGKCLDVCPAEAIVMREGKAFITMGCIEYGCCLDVCPEQAIVYEDDE